MTSRDLHVVSCETPLTAVAPGRSVSAAPGESALSPEAGLQTRVREAALACGFSHGGIAPVPPSGSARAHELTAYLEDWIARGHAGEMEYLKRRDDAGRLLRGAIQVAAPWARSIILCIAPYGSSSLPLSTEPAPSGAGWIARYAWSGRTLPDGTTVPSDYHRVLLRRLKAMESLLRRQLGEFRSWAYVDTGPLVERAWSALTGMGWTGKNTCTLNQELGSFFLLGTILTSLEVPSAQQATLPTDRCGSCTRCIDACPTDALFEPYRMDASRCISYLTIEKRGAIDPKLRAGVGRQIAGCDICQDVCPWNGKHRRSAGEQHDAEMASRTELVNPSLLELAALTRDEWQAMFFGSPLSRVKYEGFRRNLAIAMGNSGDRRMLPQLRQWACDEQHDLTLRDAADWAIGTLDGQ